MFVYGFYLLIGEGVPHSATAFNVDTEQCKISPHLWKAIRSSDLRSDKYIILHIYKYISG